MDAQFLALQSLRYEKGDLLREIARCREFRAPESEVVTKQLIPLQDFLRTKDGEKAMKKEKGKEKENGVSMDGDGVHARGGKDDRDDASMMVDGVTEGKERNEATHRLALARLDHELRARKRKRTEVENLRAKLKTSQVIFVMRKRRGRRSRRSNI